MWIPLQKAELEFTLSEIRGDPRTASLVEEGNPEIFWDGSLLRLVGFSGSYWALALPAATRVRVTVSGYASSNFNEEDRAQLRSIPFFNEGADPTQAGENVIEPLAALSPDSRQLIFYVGNYGENVTSANFLIEVCPEANKQPWWYCPEKEPEVPCPERPTGYVPYDEYDIGFKFPLASSRKRRPLPCRITTVPDEYPEDPYAPIIVSGSLPDGYVGDSVVFDGYTATGGSGPKTFALVPGSLPLNAGLSLNADGTVTGDYAAPDGPYGPWEIIATDTLGNVSEPYLDSAVTLSRPPNVVTTATTYLYGYNYSGGTWLALPPQNIGLNTTELLYMPDGRLIAGWPIRAAPADQCRWWCNRSLCFREWLVHLQPQQPGESIQGLGFGSLRYPDSPCACVSCDYSRW
jgi:hypothetical protein